MVQRNGEARVLPGPSLERLNELSVLMELRLAFGPGTRLWASRSREELCYDWLHYKARRTNESFRDFARFLYAQERQHGSQERCSSEILRRVITVLKAHRIKRNQNMVTSLPNRAIGQTGHVGHASSRGVATGQVVSGPDVPAGRTPPRKGQ
jgi:hypothetical protein